MHALILIDIQNDFIPGGSLAVADGDQIVPVANRLQPCYDLVVASQDWHPASHGSFASNHPGRDPGEMIELGGLPQVLWPNHCVQHSQGAELHPDLRRERIDHVVQKGTDPEIDSYSTFFDNGHRKATGLHEVLQSHGVTDVDLLGLATDYCVKYSALDAAKLGYRTRLVEDGCRGIDLQAGDVAAALEEMRQAGVEIITSDEVIAAGI